MAGGCRDPLILDCDNDKYAHFSRVFVNFEEPKTISMCMFG